MKREIKFKAFIKLNNEGLKFHREKVSQFINSKIHEVSSIDFRGKSICITDESGKSVETVFIEHCEIFELLEFTGLKDKNGVDIYKGDKFRPDETNDEVESVVRWDEELARFVVDSYGYDYHIGEGSQEVYDSELSICETIDLSDLILEYCEVIGSIHSNPELIK